MTINLGYLMVVATQIDENVVSARSLCALLDHVEDVFATNSGRGISGRWVSRVPWRGRICDACGSHCLTVSVGFVSESKNNRAKIFWDYHNVM